MQDQNQNQTDNNSVAPIAADAASVAGTTDIDSPTDAANPVDDVVVKPTTDDTAVTDINNTEEQAVAAQQASGAMDDVIAKINDANNILVALSSNPTVDDLAAAIGLSLSLERTGKRAVAIYSGTTPNAMEFLNPSDTLKTTADTLQDFVIAISKDKADHLRYKLDGDYVKIFITPYKTRIAEEDLEFSYGDFNIDLVIAINVASESVLDDALREQGRVLHDATVINITTSAPGSFGNIEWSDPGASSVSEMISQLLFGMGDDVVVEKNDATALLTGIIAATDRFSSTNTSPETMQVASKLMASGADQKLITENITSDLKDKILELADNVKKTDANSPINNEKAADEGILVVEKNAAPAEGSVNPTEVEAAPVENGSTVADSSVAPAESGGTVTEGSVAPAESGATPAIESLPPVEMPTPETAAPNTPETNTPETAAAEVTTAETSVPETSAPETLAPDTSAPEAAAAETVAPETPVPESTTPEVPAAETPAPMIWLTDEKSEEEKTDAAPTEASLPPVQDTTTPLSFAPNNFVSEVKTETVVAPSADFAEEVHTDSSRYGQMLQDALAELNTPETPVATPSSSAPALGGNTGEAIPPTPIDNPLGNVGNPALSMAPPVADKPEINGVPEINYASSPSDSVLPPPPAPPVDINGMPPTSGDLSAPSLPDLGVVDSPIAPAPDNSVGAQPAQPASPSDFKIPGM